MLLYRAAVDEDGPDPRGFFFLFVFLKFINHLFAEVFRFALSFILGGNNPFLLT